MKSGWLNKLGILLVLLVIVFGAMEGGKSFSRTSNKPRVLYKEIAAEKAVEKIEEKNFINVIEEEPKPKSVYRNKVIKNKDTNRNISLLAQKGTVFYSAKTPKRQVSLTFDDGPDEVNSNKILDILKQYNIKATFFVIGQNAKRYPEIIKRIEREGHTIGNHTYSHKNLDRISNDEIQSEIKKTEEVIDSILGYHFFIMRPPYGNNSPRTAEAISSLGYTIIDWSVDTLDWAGTSPSKIMEYVGHQTGPGGIILHHCTKNTVEVLPREIEKLRADNYEIVDLLELFNVKGI